MHRNFIRALGWLCLGFLIVGDANAQTPQFVPFSAAQPVLQAYQKSLPAGLNPPTATAWDAWVRQMDRDIRLRLDRGEEDTITNLLREGVTYTTQERISYAKLVRYGKDPNVDALVNQRVSDLMRAMAAPHPSEGMAELRAFLEKKGFDPATPDGRQKLRAYLLANLARMRGEVIKAEVEVYRNKGANPYQAFKERGISTDSDLYPDYGIDLHLRHMMQEGLLKAGSIHRVGIVGPGLDFVNKNSGADFYPPQTTQPFAVMDSLFRLHLANPATVELYTFDISARVNKHLERARAKAAAGKPYPIQLLSSPNDQWNKDYATGFLDYWQHLGSEIGKPVARIPVPDAVTNIWNRAVAVRPAIVERITPVDMNAVFQTLPLAPDRQFDLIIGTNIFIYYDALEQSLARANLGTMIKPGGFLLSNELLPNTAPSLLKDSLETKIAVVPTDTEHMYSYARVK